MILETLIALSIHLPNMPKAPRSPVENGSFMTIHPDGHREAWNIRPSADKLAPDTKIIEWRIENNDNDTWHYNVKDDGSLEYIPQVPVKHEPTAEELADRELQEAIRSKAADSNVSDADYAKLLRINNIQDLVIKKQKWDEIKGGIREINP